MAVFFNSIPVNKKFLILALFTSSQLIGQNPVSSFSYEQQDVFSTCVQFTNTSTGAIINYEWTMMDSVGGTFQTPNCIYCFSDKGCFPVRLVVQDINGNLDTSIQTVCIDVKSTFFLPNAFSPNGDGINDVFFAYAERIPENGFEMRIYDYWGGLVFSSFDINYGWPGKAQHSGKICPSGFYLVEIIWFDTELQKHTQRTSVYLFK